MDFFKQVGAVTALGLRTIPSRLGASLVVVIGMACAVGALVSVLSMSTGFMKSVNSTGRADRALVMSQGAQYENASSLSRANVATIADAPGVKKTADGKPILSADALTFVVVSKKSDGLDAYVGVRGIGPQGLALRPEIRLISGRMFRRGKYELIVGKAAPTAFKGVAEGSKVSLPQGEWLVTGTFESNGDLNESSLLTDAETLTAALRAPNYKSVMVMLESPAAFEGFKKALTSNPALSVDVVRETEYLARLAQTLNAILKAVAYVVGGIMGLGAMFGALNTMYSSVSARTVEIATLRAIGFGGGAVVISVLAEALLLASAGALIGAAFAWLAFNGNLHAMGGAVIRLAVTPGLALGGVVFASILGLIGGLFPAIRAARRPVATALRAT